MPLAELQARAGLGGMSPEGLGLYKDLEPFWERIGGDAIAQDAVDHVNALWESGVLTSWADAATVVEAHEPHPAAVEGTEGIGYDIVDEDGAVAAEGEDMLDEVGGVPRDDALAAAVPESMVGADDGGDKPVRL